MAGMAVGSALSGCASSTKGAAGGISTEVPADRPDSWDPVAFNTLRGPAGFIPEAYMAKITGPDGTLAPLAELSGRTLYIHMNNTNPILHTSSAETARVTRTGVEIARDGMEFEL